MTVAICPCRGGGCKPIEKGGMMARWMAAALLLLALPMVGGCFLLDPLKESQARWQDNPYTFNLDDHHEKNDYNPDPRDTYVYKKDWELW